MLQAQRQPTVFSRLTAAMPIWLRWTIAVLALAGPFLVFRHGHDLKQAVKVQLSRWDVRNAQPLLDDPLTADEGVHLLVEALIRTPEEPEVIRALAELTARAGLSAHARFFYEHLARVSKLTPEDEIARARVLARLSDSSGAQIILQKLAETHGETPDILRARADIASEGANPVQARAALEKLLRAAPADTAQTSLALAKARAQSPEAAQQHAGIETLLQQFEQSLAESDPARRQHCFWTLSSLDIADPAQRGRFAALIEKMPLLTLERRVVRRFLEATTDAGDPKHEKLQLWLKNLIATETRAGAEERLAIAKIMQKHGQHDLVLQWISFEQGLGETALCTTRVDSLLALRLWDQARQMVEDRGTPLVRPLQALLQAQIHMLSTGGRDAKSTELLGIALQEARDKGEQGNFIAAGRLASQFGHHEKALEAYGHAMQPQFPNAVFLVEPLMKTGRQAGASAGEILRLLQQRAKDEFWNQDLEHHLDHLSLLAGENLELILAKHQTIPPDDPAAPRRALFHALACLRLHEPAATLALSLARIPRSHSWTAPETVILHALDLYDALPPAGEPLFLEEKRLAAL